MSPKTKSPAHVKTCGNYIGEIKRFFDWLHLTKDFGWRKPNDHGDLNTRIRKLPSDRPSITSMEISTFSLDELALLYKHAQRFERFLLVWCLNCAHGAAEFGRVEWEDILLRKEHPWVAQGLRIETTTMIVGVDSSVPRAMLLVGGVSGQKRFSFSNGGTVNVKEIYTAILSQTTEFY